MSTISIDFFPTLPSSNKGRKGVEAVYITEVSRGCAEVLQMVGELSLHIKKIKVVFRIESDDSLWVDIMATVSFGDNKVCARITLDKVSEVKELAGKLSQKLVFEIGLMLRRLKNDLSDEAQRLEEVAPFAFREPWVP